METFTGYDELIADVQTELLAVDFASSPATTILAAFSQLKDAVGVVRAFVAAALVMDAESRVALSGRMRGTLIVAVHRQSACAATIRASAPRKLLSLVSAGFELPHEIMTVQRALESDLSVDVLSVHKLLDSLTIERWWSLASNQIDKLHSLQQTLLLALEQSAHRRKLSVTSGPATRGRRTSSSSSCMMPRWLGSAQSMSRSTGVLSTYGM